MDKVAVFVIAKVKPGKRDEIRRLYEKHIKPRVESNARQEQCVYCFANDDEDTICVFELFSDPEIVEKNLNSDWLKDYMEKELPLTAGPAQVVMATPVWIKGASA